MESPVGVNGYQTAIQHWLDDPLNSIDDEQKIEILKNLFVSTKVAFIYGAAGTGKSTLIGHISKYYSSAIRTPLKIHLFREKGFSISFTT